MKQKKRFTKIVTITRLIIVFLLLAPLFHCSKNKLDPHQVAEQLIRLMNKQLPGTYIEVKPGNRSVETLEQGHYRVTFKNVLFKTDLTWMLNIINKIFPNPTNLPRTGAATIESLVVIFHPGKEKIPLHSLRKLKIKYNVTDFGSGTRGIQELTPFRTLFASVGKIDCQDLDYSKHFKKDAKDAVHMLRNPIAGMVMPSESSVQDIQLGVTFVTPRRNLQTITLKIGEHYTIEMEDGDSSITDYIMEPHGQKPNIKALLQKKDFADGISARLKSLNISTEKNGSPAGGGQIEDISLKLFMRPGTTPHKEYTATDFRVGYLFQIKNVQMNLPRDPLMQFLSLTKEFNVSYAIENLTSRATMALLTLIRKIIQLRKLDQGSLMEIMAPAFILLGEIQNPKTFQRLSISPFKHEFGEFRLDVELRLKGLGTPHLTITLNLSDPDDIIRKLEAAEILPQGKGILLKLLIGRYFTIQPDGTVTLKALYNPLQPGYIFINGEKIILPQSAISNYRLF